MDPLTRWNQLRWSQLNAAEGQQHMLGDPFRGSKVHWPTAHERVVHWIPLVDLSEDAKEYLIKVELPQVKQDDVSITIEDGTLIIAGDRKFEKNSKRDHHVEHAYGSFVHSFSLPADASSAKVTAELNGGVLKVHLERNQKAIM